MSLSCYNYRRDLIIYSSGRVTAQCHGLTMVCELDRDDMDWYSEFEIPTGWPMDGAVKASGLDMNVYQISFERSYGDLMTTVCVSHQDNYCVDDGPTSNKPYHTVGELITSTCLLIKAFTQLACKQTFNIVCQNQPLRRSPRPQVPEYTPGMEMQSLVDMFSKEIRKIHQTRTEVSSQPQCQQPQYQRARCQQPQYQQAPCQQPQYQQTGCQTAPRGTTVQSNSGQKGFAETLISGLLNLAIPAMTAVQSQTPQAQTPQSQTPQAQPVSQPQPFSQSQPASQPQPAPPSPAEQQAISSLFTSLISQIGQMSTGATDTEAPRRAYECPPTSNNSSSIDIQCPPTGTTDQPVKVPVMEERASQTVRPCQSGDDAIFNSTYSQLESMTDSETDTLLNSVEQGGVIISDFPEEE